jgi:hypothetical protein
MGGGALMCDPAVIRQQLGSSIGALERVAAHLARLEQGQDRGVIAMARADIREQAANLLMLRARVSAPESVPPVEATQ